MAVVRPGWDPGPPHRPNARALPAHVHVAGFIDFIICVTLLTSFASTSVVSLRGTFAATTRPHVAVTERTNSNGIIAHTVRPLTAAATSRPSATATTPKSYPTPIRGQRYKLELFGKSIINDMMDVGGAAAETGVAHPALYVLSSNSFPSTLSSPLWRTFIAATLQTERTNSNGTFVDTVRPPAAAATSRPSATATTSKSYPTPIRGQWYKLRLFGKSIINDMMGVRGAAAAACASRPAIAIPKPPLRARFHCTGPNHHDGHYEDNDMYTCFHPEPSCHAGREL